MLIFYTRDKKTIRYHETQKGDVSQHYYGIVENILNILKLDILNNDRNLKENNIVFIEDLFDQTLMVARKPFYQLEHSKQSEGKKTHVFIDNRSEPRNFNLSTFLYVAKHEYGIDEKNIHVITATQHHIPKNTKLNVYYFPNFSKVFLREGGYMGNPHISVMNKTKLLTCFNRRPSLQRTIQISDIIKNFSQDEYSISLGVDETLNKPKENELLLRMYTGDPSINYPISLDKELIETSDTEQFKVNIGDASNCIFDIVNETIPTSSDTSPTNYRHGGVYYLTEKTLRPFLNHQIPILNSTVGYGKWLKTNYGFDLFEDIIDYKKWDKIPTLEGRSEMIVQEIKRFRTKHPDYNKFYRDNLFRFQLNESLVKGFDENEFKKLK